VGGASAGTGGFVAIDAALSDGGADADGASDADSGRADAEAGAGGTGGTDARGAGGMTVTTDAATDRATEADAIVKDHGSGGGCGCHTPADVGASPAALAIFAAAQLLDVRRRRPR